ncbi:MAG: IclR family transcriptional regulator [Devosia sp.]|jgi:DNA-binding IclR family transcriptional regulator|nr:IclR family transcriptional regulator [Devosiaceae bacterium]
MLEETEARGKAVPALVRTKRILDALSAGGKPKGVSELARMLDLPKSTVHGLCHTLVDLGLMIRVGPSQFAVGPHVLAWANAFEGQSDLTQEFMRIADSIDPGLVSKEAINLSIMTGAEVMYLACRRGTDPLGVSFRPGVRLPAPFTATGKAMMSTMRPEEVERLLGNTWPEPWTKNSVRSLDALMVELEETRARGYSIDNGQLRDAMVCFGAPVFNATDDHAVAGLAIGLLSGEVNEASTERVSRAVRLIADRLTHRLGGRRN